MAKKIRDKLPRATQNGIINALMLVFVPLLLIVLTEWAHRGGFSESFFTDNLLPHLPSYLLTWVLVALLYAFLCILTRRHWPAVLITGILTVIPGVITWYKLEMRGEPFLPWDISQVGGSCRRSFEDHPSDTAFVVVHCRNLSDSFRAQFFGPHAGRRTPGQVGGSGDYVGGFPRNAVRRVHEFQCSEKVRCSAGYVDAGPLLPQPRRDFGIPFES